LNPEWRSRYEVAVEATQQAARHALGYFDRGLAVETKADQSPVTIADRETEALLRRTLQAAFPGDGFLGEEQGETPGSTGFRWVIDPIDGTRSFVRGIPLWATLVGLEYKGEQIAGIVDAPALGQSWRALRGDGAFRGDRRLRVSDMSDLSKALVFYSGLSWFVEAGVDGAFHAVRQRTEKQRGFGDFYGFVLVAQGSGELMLEYGVHAWDVAALVPIVEEAGGRFSTWNGSRSIFQPDVIFSNGTLHDEVLSILRLSKETRTP
jgi:histidinol-phosphatase